MPTTYTFFDSEFSIQEQLPRQFTVSFDSFKSESGFRTTISVDNIQAGDIINDNSRDHDGYRFHDVFHYTFAALLGWSPCTRALIKRKRKSNREIDEFEDGARATITEESISLMIFNKAKQKDFFRKEKKISRYLLTQIKEMTSSFEVSIRSKKDWEKAILIGYSLFRELVKNNGGKIHFNSYTRSASFEL